MPTVLVVDDSPSDRTLAGRLLQKEPDFTVTFAGDGNEALEQIRRQTPDAVVTDLQMPGCDGLQLMEAVKRDFPRLPVILMTARGSEEIAAEALKKGAASYVPKSALAVHLRDAVTRILSAAAVDRRHSRLMHALAECSCRFVIQNDPELIESLAAHLQEMLRCLPLGDESERLRVGIAVKHALLNGLYHGNLELPLDVEDAQFRSAVSLVNDRQSEPPFSDRLLHLEARISPAAAQVVVRHEGPGFPAANLEPAFDEAHSSRHFSRGIILMQSIMDEVQFEADGRTLILCKRAVREPELDVDE